VSDARRVMHAGDALQVTFHKEWDKYIEEHSPEFEMSQIIVAFI